MVKLLAFLVCAKATVDDSGKVTLHELFDGLVIPRPVTAPLGRLERVFFVFYKVVADAPCTLELKVVKPSGEEIPGSWADAIAPVGTRPSAWHSIWAVSTGIFPEGGSYALQLLCSEVNGAAPGLLASTQLSVQVG